MPHSTNIFKTETIKFIKKNFHAHHKILDIGAGAGTYSDLLRSHFEHMDGVEVFEPYLEMFNLKDKYENVYISNACDFDFEFYDLIIVGDVLEHISEEDGIAFINKIYNKCSDLIIGIPFNSSQGVHYENEYEIHLQDSLTHKSFLEKYKGFRPLCLRYDYGIYVKDSTANKDLDIVLEEDTIGYQQPDFSETFKTDLQNNYPNVNILRYEDLLEVEQSSKSLKIEEGSGDFEFEDPKNLTIVSGLWNIGNETRGRDWERYEKYFDMFLKIPCNMYLFIPSYLQDFVWARRSPKNTHVRIFELEDIKLLFDPFWDKWQSLRGSEKWQNITGEHGWLKDSPQLKHEYYNPIVMSKMFMLHEGKIANVFDDEYLMWLDAGICQTVYENYLWDEKIIKSLTDYMKPFLFLSYPYNKNQDEVHGFELEALKKFAGGTNPEYVCRGGLFGGHRDFLSEANTEYYTLLNNTLSEGYAGTEESVFAILAHLYPENYRRYSLDENGLIVKFIQELLAGTAELDKVEMGNRQFRSIIRNISEVKTNLYFLTFNYPEQLEYTITSLGNHKGFLDHPYQKVIIDNSTDEQARIDNKNICDKYGFEHIIRGENTGINGGRQFAAEHFHDSDADFYLFFEDDMTLADPEEGHYCRNGLRKYIPDVYLKLHQVMLKEDFDFLKLSFTEVYMDNNMQTSWYNVPQEIRDRDWPEYNKLPTTGLDPYSPRTVFRNIERLEDGLCYINGEIYYSNWPMIVSREGNRKMFIETTWAHPYEQTWMSHMYQETKKGNLKPAVLLASPVTHERFKYYQPEERREN